MLERVKTEKYEDNWTWPANTSHKEKPSYVVPSKGEASSTAQLMQKRGAYT
jgi:hypothetical protein